MLTPQEIEQAKQQSRLGGVPTTSSAMTPEQARAWIGSSTNTNAPSASPIESAIDMVGGPLSNKVIPAVTSEVQSIGSDWNKRVDNTAKIENSSDNIPSKILQTAGQGFGAVNDVIEEGVKGAVNAIVPKEVVDSFGAHLAPLVQQAAGSPAGKAIIDWWGGLNPETQRNLSATGNIASLLSNALGAGAAKEGVTAVAEPVIGAVDGAVNATTKSVGAIKDSVIDTASNIKDALTPVPDFEKNLNKAFPPSKKEIQLGDKRIKDAGTVFQDIISNKDINGIKNDVGDAKNPSEYTFQDTMDAQGTRMPQIYKDYTSKLEGIDKSKFDTKVTGTVVDAITDLENKIAKENSVPDREAMVSLKKELGGLRDTSPVGMQDYLQKLGQRSRSAPGAALTQEQIQTANLAGKIKSGLDDAVESSGDTGYAAGRQLYAAHKTMQDAFIRSALKELKAQPGLMDKLTTLGVTGEGIQFLLTHNPASLVAAAGVKGANKFMKWFNSPERALKNIYKTSESQLKNPSSLSPDATKIPAIKSSTIMPDNVSQ